MPLPPQEKAPKKRVTKIARTWMRKRMRSIVPSHFGDSREAAAVEVVMGGAYALCHFCLEAIQQGLHQVLRGYHCQRRVIMLSKTPRNVLLLSQSLTPWLHTTIQSLHWRGAMGLMLMVLELVLFSMFLLHTFLVLAQSSPTIEIRARRNSSQKTQVLF